MSSKPAIHTVKTDTRWATITEGASRHVVSAPTKGEAE